MSRHDMFRAIPCLCRTSQPLLRLRPLSPPPVLLFLAPVAKRGNHARGSNHEVHQHSLLAHFYVTLVRFPFAVSPLFEAGDPPIYIYIYIYIERERDVYKY